MSEKQKIGLVLEGGGMRGMYTTAVLDNFLELGVHVDALIGVSAGAIHGASYLSQQIGRNVRYNLKYIGDKRYMSIRSLIQTGDLFNKEFCYDTIPNELNKFDYETFTKNAEEIPFYVVCTNLETGKAEYIRITDLKKDMDYMRASASLPLVSNTIEAGGMKLLDGGTADSIPIEYMRRIGYEKNIVVLTRPEGYMKRPEKTMKFLEIKYKNYPNYLESCRKRAHIYNATLEKLQEYEKDGSVLVIRPSREFKISRTERNVDKLKYLYKMGRYDTRRMIDEIKAFTD